MNIKLYSLLMFMMMQVPIFCMQTAGPNRNAYIQEKLILEFMLKSARFANRELRLDFIALKMKTLSSCWRSPEENHSIQERLHQIRNNMILYSEIIDRRKQGLSNLKNEWRARQ